LDSAFKRGHKTKIKNIEGSKRLIREKEIKNSQSSSTFLMQENTKSTII